MKSIFEIDENTGVMPLARNDGIYLSFMLVYTNGDLSYHGFIFSSIHIHLKRQHYEKGPI